MTGCGNSWLMYGREFEVMMYKNPGEGIEKIICLDDGIAKNIAFFLIERK